MTETEVDDYKLNSTGREQSLRVSIINNQQIALVLTNKQTNQRYSSYQTLQSLQKYSKAFNKVKTIQEALSILKNAIENGGMALTEDPKDSSMSINFEISLASGKYPEFEINLTEETPIENNNQNNNDQEELPPTFDYQGNLEAQAKYGNNTKGTTEYTKPVIESDIKPPIVQYELIEPVLQIHYPDGTTKSKALPVRVQKPDGTKADMSAEEIKLIQQQMNIGINAPFRQLSPIKDKSNINRSNSVTRSFKSMYSTQTMPYPSSSNMANKNPFGNVVRPAMKTNPSNNMNNINQVRSAFSSNPDTTMYNYSGIQKKTSSDYSTMTMQNTRPYTTNNREFVLETPKPTIPNNFNNTYEYGSQYYTQSNNVSEFVGDRRQRMTHQNQNPYLQKGNNRSFSSGHNNYMNFNTNRAGNIYQSNQTNYQTNYSGYQTNQSFQQNQRNTSNITTTNYGQIHINKLPDNQGFNRNTNTVQNLQTPGLYYNQNQNAANLNNSGMYNQNQANKTNPVNNMRIIQQNNSSLAMQQSQELVKRHQTRLQEVQRQLALIQQQQQKLQEQQKQLMLQQKLQREIIQKHTLTNNVPSNNQGYQNKFQGFAEVNQIGKLYPNQQYNQNAQIRQVQTLTNNQPFLSQGSQEIKQTKTSTFNTYTNPPLRTQSSTPVSFQAPSLSNYQTNIAQSSGQYNNIKEDEITEQQIALAQMASMQNQENPEYQNLKAITLQQREEESPEVKEETAAPVTEEPVQEQEQEPEQEELDIEALFMTEEGRIIFRNGLLRGIIHKYAEIDDVITKIQDTLCKGVKFNLVYKAFDMGDDAKVFHEKCDKSKMSLVLIETDKDVRFGGFTTKSWEGNNLKKKDNNSFVFNLETNSIFDIIPNEPAIGCYPKFGPVFFGCQIRIYDKFFTKGGTTCHKGLNYKTKKDYELNNGEQTYLIKDIEVYDIEAIDV